MRHSSKSMVGLLTVASVSGVCMAQEQQPDAGASVAEVTVTASRIERSGFTAPTPTTTLGSEDRELRASPNIASLVNELPSVRPAAAALTSQNTGIQAINLRGLNGTNNASTRTLVLVDGHRFVPTTVTGVVDSNVVPNALVDRVEVVTGGASAAWGSDAVAGVVNFIFKPKIEGFQGTVQYGVSQRGDNDETSASLAWGTSFAGGRGQVMIAGEYDSQQDRQTWGDREWSNRRTGFVSGPLNGVNVTRLQVDGLTMSGVTTGGVIVASNGGPLPTTSPLRGIQFGAGSTVIPFNYGTNVGNVVMAGGDGDWWESNLLMSAPVDRKNVYGRTTFDFTDSVRGSFEASVMKSSTASPTQPLYNPNADATINVTRDNAFLQTLPGLQRLRDILTANPTITSFSVGRRHEELGRDIFAVDNRSTRFVAGLDGDLAGSWRWKTYGTYGETQYDSNVPNHLTQPNARASFDAVLENGQIICRMNSTLAANIAIVSSPTYAGRGARRAAWRPTSSVRTRSVRRSRTTSSPHRRSPRRTSRKRPAPRSRASRSRRGRTRSRSRAASSGARNRWTATAIPFPSSPTPVYPTGGFQFGNPKPIHGSYDVKEAFVETVVPLAKDQPWAQALDLNAAGRRTDYSTSGQVTTWKAGLTYRPIESLMLRGTRSRDIRAANLNELYASSTIIAFGATDYGLVVNGVPSSYNGLQSTTGNPNLLPEKADTKTFGISWEPGFLEGFRASVDYFDIAIAGAITARGAQTIVNSCYGQQGSPLNVADCQFITRDPTSGRITAVDTFPVNSQSQATRGIDYELGYGTRLPAAFGGGNLRLRLLATELTRLTLLGVDRAGEIGTGTSSPRWRGTLSATYQKGPWTLFGQTRYIDSGTYDNTFGPTAISNNEISSRTYVDATLQYQFEHSSLSQLQLFARVTNLFDRDPPILGNALINSPPTDQPVPLRCRGTFVCSRPAGRLLSQSLDLKGNLMKTMTHSLRMPRGLRLLLATLALAFAGHAAADTVLITGANSGIGLEFAKQYAEKNWTVIATHRHNETPDSLAKLIAKHPNVRAEKMGWLRARDSVYGLAKKLQGQPIDVLINNAGIFCLCDWMDANDTSQRFGTLRYEDFDPIFETNVRGVIMVSEAFHPERQGQRPEEDHHHLLDRGHDQQARQSGVLVRREQKPRSTRST
ncbi:MAG: TonB-dependent receptor [Gammaproteobacteria bacterium]